MDRLPSTNRTKHFEIHTPESENSEQFENEKYFYEQLEMADLAQLGERAAVLSHILESHLQVPQQSMCELLSQIVLVTFGLDDNEATQINEKILNKFLSMAHGQTINSAAHDMKSVAELMLTSAIIRPSEFVWQLEIQLAATAEKIDNPLFSQYTFEKITSPLNLKNSENINQQILAAASLLPSLPQERQLECLLVLYRMLPNEPQERLSGLEAIMTYKGKIPETHDSFSVLGSINQEIYELRLAHV